MNEIARKVGIVLGVAFSVAATMMGCAAEPEEPAAASSADELTLCWPWSPFTIIADAKKSKDQWDACLASKKGTPGYRWADCDAPRQRDVCGIWERASACMNAAGQVGGASSDWQATQGSTTDATACINEPANFNVVANERDIHVCFYTDTNAGGESFCSNGGLIPNLPRNFRNKISSVVFQDNANGDHLELHLFSETGFRGQERVITSAGIASGKHTLSGFNDKTKSIVVDRVRVPSPGNCDRTYFHGGRCDVDEHL